jgi:FtsZ-binding cell division protein ZapB
MNDFLSLKTDVLKKQNEKDNLETEITVKRKTAQTVYESESALMQEKLDRKAENLESEYKEIVKEANQQYLQVLEDLSTRAQENVESISLLELKLKELKAKHDAAVEEYKRAQEMETQAEFYKLQLSERDLEEIKKLREVEPYLRDPRPLNKVIWSVYYEHPYTNLIGRVVGAGRHTGIYKLTNTYNKMVYVGQAANFADRWKQHIKCALGAENAPNNKLYPAMKEYGPESFTFEIIEECLPEELNSREQYWQEFYKAKEFGYSVR